MSKEIDIQPEKQDFNLSKTKRNELLKRLDNALKSTSDEEIQKTIKLAEKEISGLKYGLVYEEHQEIVDSEMLRKVPVIVEDKTRRIYASESENYNFLLEGDNLHSLNVLLKTHRGKFDVIYIDPPYNVGKSDWKYNNKFIDKNDTYIHSKWLSFMAARLKIAKQLLKTDPSESGVMIVTIDRHEQAPLVLLLEEIFGDAYDVDCITIVHNPRGQQGDNFSFTHEYALYVYKHGCQAIRSKKIDDSEVDWAPLRNWGGESSRYDAANCFYPILVKNGEIIGFGPDITKEDIHPKQTEYDPDTDTYSVYPIKNGEEHKWRYARDTVESILPFLRVKKISDNEYDIELGKNFENYKSVWYDSLYDANKYGTQLISDMVPENDFDFPKSIYATYECLYSVVGDRPNAKVLDFFAGSGTTGHAVLMMNKLLGGNRTFVLCTNNDIGNKKEKEFKKAVGNPEDHPDEYADYCDKYGIARSITYPRIKAAIEGFQHTGKFNDELYSKRLTKTVLNKIESEVKKANKVLEDNSSKYGSIELTVKDDCIKVIGTYDKKEDVPGIPANLIYFKTAFVDKKLDDLDYLLSDALSPYCKDMIQLENWTSIPNQKYLIINTDDEAQEVEKDLSKMNGAQKIFYQTGVLLSSSIIDYANEHNILLLSLPSHYFAKELDEVGE